MLRVVSCSQLIETFAGVERPESSGARVRGDGEWDWAYHVTPREMRRLTAAGYFRRGGMHPDVFAELLVNSVPGVESTDAAFEWWVTTCLQALDERATARSSAVAWEDEQQPDPDGPRRMPSPDAGTDRLGKRQIQIIEELGNGWQTAANLTRAVDPRYGSATGAERTELVRSVKRNLRTLEVRGLCQVETIDGSMSARFVP